MENFFREILPILVTFGIPILIGILSSSRKKKKRESTKSNRSSIFNMDSHESGTDSEIGNIFNKQEEARTNLYEEDESENTIESQESEDLAGDPERTMNEKKEIEDNEGKVTEEKKEKESVNEQFEEGKQQTENRYKEYYTPSYSKKQDAISKIKEDFDLEEGIIYSEILNRKHF